MNILDEWLAKLGLTYDELKADERAEYDRMYKALQVKEMTIALLKVHLANLREIVEIELEKYDNSHNQDLYLKARLKNLRLIEAFITSPEKAKAAVERSIKI